ncbi:MAG TPA: TonB-dependent receptor plug domain-containing protein [Chitinophagaceae bacterium]|nr:TonB-dependent receptor plug domain-containing protein [Chitinophagaceae bacterium]
MRITSYSAILASLLFASTIKIAAQITDSVSAIFTKFIQTSTNKSIVLLTNRNIYLAGEKIWFKAYSVATHDGKLDLASKNLFADLVSEKDSVIEQVVLDNSGMHTDGAFNLPGSIPTGFYWIRCYTVKQLENKKDVFLHPVYIVNKQLHDEGIYARKFENNLVHNGSNPSVHFYAERLTAIPGIISTGVIEIRDGHNNPLSATGSLLDSKDSIITSFKTNSLGLTRLTFVDEPSETYTAVFYLNNQALRYQLPAPDKTSIQLSVANQNTKTIKAFVTLEDSVPVETHTTILAVQRDSLYWAAVGAGSYGITIPTDNFPGGIVRLLLFDGKKNLVSERKIYIPKENVEIEVKPDKKRYSPRENVNLHLKISQPTREPLVSMLNIAVEDERVQKFSDSIETNGTAPPNELLFHSWLKRFKAKYSDDDIDLLMITRKPDFRPPFDTSSHENEVYEDNTKLLNLVGKVMNRKGNGINNRIVNALAKNSRQFFMDVDTTDQDGMFSLSMPQGFDSLHFSLQVTDKHLVQMPSDSIKIESFHYPDLSTSVALKQQSLFNSFNALSSLKRYHVDTTSFFQGVGWLTPVTVTAIKKVEPNYDVSRRLNSISQIVTSDKIRYAVGPEGIMNLLRMVPGVTVYDNDFVIFGPSHDFAGHVARPLLVVDGIPMPDRVGALGYLTEAVNPADIDFIEILRGGEAAQFGSRGAGGVISVNTKHGPDRTDYLKSNLRVFAPVTYHVCPKFEMPDYSNKEIKNSSTPDTRTAIYWNGNIITNTNGEADINFYTGDNLTNYAITITGLTANGDLIYKRIVIENRGKNR